MPLLAFFGGAGGFAVLLRGPVPRSPGRAQLRADYQRGRHPAHVGGDQGWRHGHQAVLLRGSFHLVEQGKIFVLQ